MQPISTSSDRPHAPPMDEEAIYYEGSPLLGGRPEKVFLLAVAGTFFLIVPILIRVVFKFHSPEPWTTLILLAVGLCFWISTFVIVKSIRYRISNYRIDYERGIISKNINTLELWHVEDIAFHQSIIGRILGIGTISVTSHDDNMPDLEMRG